MRIAGTDTTFSDGIGKAFIIYFQGCNLFCHGCHNPELQDFEGGYETTVDEIIEYIEDFYDSVVFSGGEPLCQIKELRELMSRIELPKVLYTGIELNRIPWYIGVDCDIIVAGPYDDDKKTGGFPASSNQRVLRRTTNAHKLHL